ncbi:MAG: hypothetical protein K6E53_16740 [Lachnospiraceae bacterium]|nr:hypothetical protein [Lachnospiraceae bacterium]
MKNKAIRDALAKQGLFLYQLGKILNVSEATVTRMMREELPEPEQRRIVNLIKKGGTEA